MTEDVLTFDELRQAQSRERDSDTLQELDDDFFDRARRYLDMKRDPEDALQGQEYRNARNLLQDIVDRRQKKIVKLAFLSVKSGVSVDNLMAHEEALFEQLTDTIDAHRFDVEAELLSDGTEPGDVTAAADDGGERRDDEADEAADEETGTEPAADTGKPADAGDVEPASAPDEEDKSPAAADTDAADADDGDRDEEDATELDDAEETLLFGGSDAEDDEENGEDAEQETDADGDDPGEDTNHAADADDDAGDGMVTIRLTTDVQEFMGTDLEAYGPFEEGEEAVVPEKNADVLQEQDKAERL